MAYGVGNCITGTFRLFPLAICNSIGDINQHRIECFLHFASILNGPESPNSFSCLRHHKWRILICGLCRHIFTLITAMVSQFTKASTLLGRNWNMLNLLALPWRCLCGNVGAKCLPRSSQRKKRTRKGAYREAYLGKTTSELPTGPFSPTQMWRFTTVSQGRDVMMQDHGWHKHFMSGRNVKGARGWFSSCGGSNLSAKRKDQRKKRRLVVMYFFSFFWAEPHFFSRSKWAQHKQPKQPRQNPQLSSQSCLSVRVQRHEGGCPVVTRVSACDILFSWVVCGSALQLIFGLFIKAQLWFLFAGCPHQINAALQSRRKLEPDYGSGKGSPAEDGDGYGYESEEKTQKSRWLTY